jgi:hypothetical protein
MDPIAILQSITLLLVVKVLVVALLAIYAIFAGLMMTQIGAMTRAVVIKDGFIMKILGIIHFAFALLILLGAIFIL